MSINLISSYTQDIVNKAGSQTLVKQIGSMSIDNSLCSADYFDFSAMTASFIDYTGSDASISISESSGTLSLALTATTVSVGTTFTIKILIPVKPVNQKITKTVTVTLNSITFVCDETYDFASKGIISSSLKMSYLLNSP